MAPRPKRLPLYLVVPRRLRRTGRAAAGRVRAARRPGPARHLRALRGLRRRRRPPARLDAGARPAGRPRATSTASAAPCARCARRARCSARSRRGCRAGRWPQADPQRVRRSSPAGVREAKRADGRLTLTPPAPTRLRLATCATSRQPGRWCRWSARRPALADRRLRRCRASCARTRRATRRSARARPAARPRALQRLEDHDLTNSSRRWAPSSPGWFRAGLVLAMLLGDRLRLPPRLQPRQPGARPDDPLRALGVLDDKTRVLFVSNYDGSLESYMDDFINKAACGLNLSFSQRHRLSAHALADPRRQRATSASSRSSSAATRLPTQVWYKAYPGLTLAISNATSASARASRRDA